MGIPGIYKEIGPGERTALSKLAVEHIENTGRPLRIAIDISIWQFQIQSGEGGKNPALRTLYYRLLKLLALSIQPLFVFDGPHKPPFKRGSKTNSHAACLPNFLTKELLKCFGFPYHTAPGEAEAECAFLQKEGIVDAVLSEDVDTLMFGCTMSLRNWTAEAVRGNSGPTHVNIYRAATTKARARLDSEGMILVALMSGGDYIPAGIPRCGIKTACEAAKAGFGHDLCKLSRKNSNGLQQWREKLERELRTNDSKLFRQRHKALKIPESFPNMTVLSYYTDPVVSSADKVSKLRDEINWDSELNVSGLRMFVSEAFDWQYLAGAKKFIRGLAPALLVHRLIHRSTVGMYNDDTLEMKESNEKALVKAVSNRRVHWNTDGTPELRIAYIPADIVGLDLSAEEEGDFQGYINDVSGDEQLVSGGENPGQSESPTKRRGPSTYEPTAIEKIWVLETYVKLGVPLLAETWEEDMRNSKKFATRKAREQRLLSKFGPKPGAMDQFVKITKAGVGRATTKSKPAVTEGGEQHRAVVPGLATTTASQCSATTVLSEYRKPVSQKVRSKREKKTLKMEKTPTSKATPLEETGTSPRQLPSSSPVDININPWTLSKRPSDTFGFKPSTRYSALGIYPSDESENIHRLSETTVSGGEIQQAYASPSATPSRKRYTRPTTPISDGEEMQSLLQSQEFAKDLSTPTARDQPKSSPRKKRSPLQLVNRPHESGGLLTPKTPRTDRPGDKVVPVSVEPLTSQRVNRKLEFTSPKALPVPNSPSSDTSSLPSPSALLSPTAPKEARDTRPSPISPPTVPTCTNKTKPTKKLVALRASLEGAWKHLEPWEANPNFVKGAYSSVEVLDLTAG